MNENELTNKVQRELKEQLQSIRGFLADLEPSLNDDLIFQLNSISNNITETLELFKKDEVNRKERTGWSPRKTLRIKKEQQNFGQIIEGIFNGVSMITNIDGNQLAYSIPEEYAIKSMLVVGDCLKLTINKMGDFKYKEMSHVARKKCIGTLILNKENSTFLVESDGRTWDVLQSCVSFYDGKHGDDVVFYIPQNDEVQWAAIERIIHQTEENDDNYTEFVNENVIPSTIETGIPFFESTEKTEMPVIEELPDVTKPFEESDDFSRVEEEQDLTLDKDFDLFSADLEEPELPREDLEFLEELFYDGLLKIDDLIEEGLRA